MNKNIDIFKKINPYCYYILWIMVYLLLVISKYNFTPQYYIIESIQIFNRGLLIVMFLTFFHLEWIKKNWKFTITVNIINLCILVADIIYRIYTIK
jgi:hypothetical protein